MANYISSLTGSEMDTALGTLNEIYPVDGIVKGDGEGGFEAVDVDTTPTQSSENLVSSGGVLTAINNATSGKASKSSVLQGTLTVAGWTNNQQTLTFQGQLPISGYAYTVSPTGSSFTNYAEAMIHALDVTVADSITFVCDSVPTVAINIVILKQEVV